MAILVPRQPAGALPRYTEDVVIQPGTRNVGTASAVPKMISEAIPIPGISSGVTAPKETVRTGTAKSTNINPLAGAAIGALAANIIAQRAATKTGTQTSGGTKTGGGGTTGGTTGGGTRPSGGGTTGGTTGGGTTGGGTSGGGGATYGGAGGTGTYTGPIGDVVQNPDGTTTQTMDDGSTITTDENGNIVNYTEGTQDNWTYDPETGLFYDSGNGVFYDPSAGTYEFSNQWGGSGTTDAGITDTGSSGGSSNIIDTTPINNWDNVVTPIDSYSIDLSNLGNYYGGLDFGQNYFYDPGSSYDFSSIGFGTGSDYGGFDYGSFFKDGGMATPLMKEGGVIKMADGGNLEDPIVTTTSNDTTSPAVTEITNTALPGENGYGWRYFSDGTAIGPDGNYYYQGQQIYDPNVGFSGLGTTIRNVVSGIGGASSGALNAIKQFTDKYPGTSGAAVGALLSQMLSNTGGGSKENLGVDMTKFGAIKPRTTTFGVGAPRFLTYQQYGSQQQMPEMYGSELYRNLNAPGFNPVNPTYVEAPQAHVAQNTPVAPQTQQPMRRGGLAHMADGGQTYYTYGRAVNPADNLAAGGQPIMGGGVSMVEGRIDYREGSHVEGPGDGQSDDIPAMLADGEYVIDAETVAMLGNGSNKAGAKKLDEFRMNIRKHKRDTPLNKIPPPSKSPLSYLKGAK